MNKLLTTIVMTAAVFSVQPSAFTRLISDFRDNYAKLPALLDIQQMKADDKAWFLRQVLY